MMMMMMMVNLKVFQDKYSEYIDISLHWQMLYKVGGYYFTVQLCKYYNRLDHSSFSMIDNLNALI